MDRKEYVKFSYKRKMIDKQYFKIRKILLFIAEIMLLAGYSICAVSNEKLKNTFILVVIMFLLAIWLLLTDKEDLRTDWKYVFSNSLWMHLALTGIMYFMNGVYAFLLIFEIVPYYYFFNKYYRQHKSKIAELE